MANCPSCREQVHPKATRCPHCAGRIGRFSLSKLIGAFSLIGLVVYCAGKVDRVPATNAAGGGSAQTSASEAASTVGTSSFNICDYDGRPSETAHQKQDDAQICEESRAKSRGLETYERESKHISSKAGLANAVTRCGLRDASWHSDIEGRLSEYRLSPRMRTLRSALTRKEREQAERYDKLVYENEIRFTLGDDPKNYAGSCKELASMPFTQTDAAFLPDKSSPPEGDTPAAEASARPDALMGQWSKVDYECRGGSHQIGDAVCNRRDELESEINQQGWCWAYSDDRPAYLNSWHHCSEGDPR